MAHDNDSAVARALAWPIRILVIACGWWLIALSAATCVEMVARKLFRFSLQGVDEIGGYTLAVASAIGFSYALLNRAHTRVDFLLSRFSVRVRAWLNVVAMVTLAAMSGFGVWRGFDVLAESIEFQSTATTPLQTPLWIPQSLWLLGWALFAALALGLAIQSARLLTRDVAELNRRFGPPTLEEEIEAEAGEVLRDLQTGRRP